MDLYGRIYHGTQPDAPQGLAMSPAESPLSLWTGSVLASGIIGSRSHHLPGQPVTNNSWSWLMMTRASSPRLLATLECLCFRQRPPYGQASSSPVSAGEHHLTVSQALPSTCLLAKFHLRLRFPRRHQAIPRVSENCRGVHPLSESAADS